ncbi:MAG: aminopeptidase [Alistipes sp.]|nr:aminopeptidase [Candidatus Minthomonas equi]
MELKTILLCAAALLTVSTPLSAQKKKAKEAKPEGYQFTTQIELPVTSIKNQASSGTCWAFSSVSFFESEILKNGYTGELDLSEMFFISHAYQDRADKFVRLHGALEFGGGSSFGNVLQIMKKYGAVPESTMPGLNYGTDKHRHGELDALAKAYVNVMIKNPNRKLSTAWKNGFKGIMDAYLGPIPENFESAGKEYTPKTYMESLGIDLNDYVDIVSWTHVPYYEKTVQLVPDNWIWEESYNVPLDELVEIINSALSTGYTVAWASDVSENGFSRAGLGIVPDYEAMKEAAKETGTDEARWIGAKPEELKSKALEGPCPELEITPELRQEGYDTYQTTDDHGMHIYGKATDQNGKPYFIVKNSWGDAGDYKGIWYVSEAYVRYKTMDILVNKKAIPAHIREKLGL